MNVIVYLATKYLKFKGTDRGISIISVIALLTIVVSAMAATVILSAANGMHYNYMDKLASKDFHAVIYGYGRGVPDYETLALELKKAPGVVDVVPFLDQQALIKGPLGTYGVMVKAFPREFYQNDREFRTRFALMKGEETNASWRHAIFMGYNLADNLGVSVGDWVYLTLVNDDMLSLLQYKFRVAGIFEAGYAEYDTSLVFVNLEDALVLEDNTRASLAIRVKDPFQIERWLPKIREISPFYVYSWKSLNRNNLVNIRNEKMMMRIILTIFFIVVCFNILSTMMATVLDKREEIGILKAMGLRPKSVMSVFLMDGFLIGVIGSAVGIFFGLFFALNLNNILHGIEAFVNFWNQVAYLTLRVFMTVKKPAKFEFFDPTAYYIREFPMRIQLEDLVVIMGLSVVCSMLAVIWPAYRAGKLRPIEVLRND
ncbi:MAG: ABC transporter permease [Brevinematales bacterium]|nr:ABC transporter permease [Brevinematales bacterium]